MISIVLPTYNGEKYLACSIESILQQTYGDFELIIVDDCSQDSTLEIMQKYASQDHRIKIIHNNINKKLPASLNIGFAQAKGEYLTWTSDDNIFHATALEKLISALEMNKEIGVVYGLYNFIDENEDIVGKTTMDSLNVRRIYGGNPIGACFMYTREVHEKLNGYDESKFLVEDYDFWLRAKRYFKFYLLPEYLYDYRIHGSSLTETRNREIRAKTVELIAEEIQRTPLESDELLMAYDYIVRYYFDIYDRIKLHNYMKKVKILSKEKYHGYGYKYLLSQYFDKRLVMLILGVKNRLLHNL